jgi:hypothetical protein
MANKPQKKYVVHEDTLYEEENKGLYVTYKKYKLPVIEPCPRWTGPKIPFDLWEEMVAWCQVTQNKFKSEALVFLFLDTENEKWHAWYLPQITNGMTVKADENHEDYTNQRTQFPDLQFGSLHHHCTSSAFASGVDQEDERNREGLHFTIGDLGQSEHSIHYRFCIEGQCHEGEAHEVIDYHPSIKAVPEKYREKIHADMIKERFDGWTEKNFEEQLKNVSKETYQVPVKKHQHYRQMGIGYSIPTNTPISKNTATTEEEIMDYLDMDPSIDIELFNNLEDNGYATQSSHLPDVLDKILKYWDKTYKNKRAEEKRNSLIEDVVYTITGVIVSQHTAQLTYTVKQSIQKWLEEYNNERSKF